LAEFVKFFTIKKGLVYINPFKVNAVHGKFTMYDMGVQHWETHIVLDGGLAYQVDMDPLRVMRELENVCG
jgi:hypothetical protein